MDSLALRVASLFALRLADEGEEEPGKGGVPPRWQEWLDAVHQGGKKQVPNPKSETRDRFPQVAFTTALKDKDVFKKAIKEYHDWIKKNPETDAKPADKAPAKEPENDSAPPKKEEPKNEDKAPAKEDKKGTPGIKPRGALVISETEVDEYLSKNKKELDELTTKMKSGVGDFVKKRIKERGPASIKKAFMDLSETEKMIHVNGHLIGDFFQKALKKNKRMSYLHEVFVGNWTNGSGRVSDPIQGCMANLGVEGFPVPGEEKDAKAGREKGAKNDEMAEYVHEVMKFNQAVFKHLGLKEVTVFRGVMGQGVDKAKPGDDLAIKTRELSSFTTDPAQALGFGTTFRMKVPVENIFWSSMTSPLLGSKALNNGAAWGEAEMVVMGGSAITGTCIEVKR